MLKWILLPANGLLKAYGKVGSVKIENKTNRTIILEVSDDNSEIKIIDAN